MTFGGINYVAVVLAAVVGFIFGGVWYGVFSNRWMAAANLTPESIQASRRGSPVWPFAVAFVALLIMAFFLAVFLSHLGEGQVTAKNGLVAGASVWLGFVATTLAVNHTFQGAKKELTLIDAGHWLGVLLVQGLLIGWMGVG